MTMSDEHEPSRARPPAGARETGDAGRCRFAGAGRSVAQQLYHCQICDGGPGGGLSCLRPFPGRPQEKAVILRFGKPVGHGQEALLGPGLHWSFPYPIDEVVRIPITEIQKVTSTIGWYYLTPEQQASGIMPCPGPSLYPAGTAT